MTKVIAAIALTFALTTSAVAAPTYGLSVGSGVTNPFEAGINGGR